MAIADPMSAKVIIRTAMLALNNTMFSLSAQHCRCPLSPKLTYRLHALTLLRNDS